MRPFIARALVGLSVMTGTPAMAQKHPADQSVDLPGDNSPSTIARAHPYARKTVPLPEKAETPARKPTISPGPDRSGLPAANPSSLPAPTQPPR